MDTYRSTYIAFFSNKHARKLLIKQSESPKNTPKIMLYICITDYCNLQQKKVSKTGAGMELLEKKQGVLIEKIKKFNAVFFLNCVDKCATTK